MTMTYTEALKKSRGLNKTAALPELEGWQRAGIGGLGGGLLTAGLTSLVAPKASTKSKLLAALIGAGGGAAAGYRYLPGYGASKDVAEAPASAPAEEKPDAAAASATPVASGGETKGEDKDKDKDKREAPTGKPSPDAPSGGGRPDGGGDGGGNDDGGGVGLRELLGGAAAVEGGRRLWKKYRAGRSGGGGGNGPGASGSGSLPDTGPTPLLGGPSGSGSPSSGRPSGSGPALLPGGQSASTSRARAAVARAGEDRPAAGLARARDSARAARERNPLNRMRPETAERALFDMAQGFDPRIPREVQLKALQSAYKRNLDLSHGPLGGEKYWVTRISRQIRQKAIEALKASNPQFKDKLREDLGQRGYEVYRTDLSYVPVIDRGGKYSLRKLDPFETLDPLTAASLDDRDRRNAIMKGTPNVWDAKHYGGRLRPSKLRGVIGGWVPEMAPSAESKSVRAARLARAVNAGSSMLPILLRALDN